jgi:hypothetical protein
LRGQLLVPDPVGVKTLEAYKLDFPSPITKKLLAATYGHPAHRHREKFIFGNYWCRCYRKIFASGDYGQLQILPTYCAPTITASISKQMLYECIFEDEICVNFRVYKYVFTIAQSCFDTNYEIWFEAFISVDRKLVFHSRSDGCPRLFTAPNPIAMTSVGQFDYFSASAIAYLLASDLGPLGVIWISCLGLK